MNLSIGPAIDIIIGPMFSGKTSELLRRLSIYHDMEKKVLYVNSAQDSRSGEDFSTHNPCIGKIPFHSQKTNNLESVDFESYDVIGIDEASLFSALKSFVLKWVAAGKTIIVAGLNADSNGNKLGEIVDLIPVCDQLCKLFGFCLPCNKRGVNSASVMTKRIVNNTNQILIGGKDSYIPVCRKCHMEIDALCEGYKLHQLNQGDNQINNQINNRTDNKTDNKTDKTDIKKSASDLESFIRAYETFHTDKNLEFNTKHNFVLDSLEEKNKPEEISVVKLIKQQIFCDPCSTISHSFNDDIALKVTTYLANFFKIKR
jgi:thymidine kinase